jgi:hypothetical protein
VKILPTELFYCKIMIGIYSISLIILVLKLVKSTQYTDDAIKDRIISLPGQTSPFLSNQFSGFLQISESKFIHYYYIESEKNAASDPLVFWT